MLETCRTEQEYKESPDRDTNTTHKPRAAKLLQMSKYVWIKKKKICVKQNKSVKPHGGNVLVWGMMWR